MLTALRALWREYLEICAAHWMAANTVTVLLPADKDEVGDWAVEIERLNAAIPDAVVRASSQSKRDRTHCSVAASIAGIISTHVADIYHDAAHVSASHWGMHRIAQRQ